MSDLRDVGGEGEERKSRGRGQKKGFNLSVVSSPVLLRGRTLSHGSILGAKIEEQTSQNMRNMAGV